MMKLQQLTVIATIKILIYNPATQPTFKTVRLFFGKSHDLENSAVRLFFGEISPNLSERLFTIFF